MCLLAIGGARSRLRMLDVTPRQRGGTLMKPWAWVWAKCKGGWQNWILNRIDCKGQNKEGGGGGG